MSAEGLSATLIASLQGGPEDQAGDPKREARNHEEQGAGLALADECRMATPRRRQAGIMRIQGPSGPEDHDREEPFEQDGRDQSDVPRLERCFPRRGVD